MRLACAFLVLSSLMAAAAEVLATPPTAEVAAADFSVAGPCGYSSWKFDFPVPAQLQPRLPATLALNVTIPLCPEGASEGLPFVKGTSLFFFNGFQAKASWYYRLVQQAASWGLSVVQYNTPAIPFTTIATEMELFPFLTQWLSDQSDDPASPLYGLVDPSRLATAGHSRGGKLASLVFTSNPDQVGAAYLVDPVDNTRWSPESADNPSATRALEASGRAVGISAAGRISGCNPADAGYQTFWAAAGNGSWLGLLPGATHSQFSDAGCLGNAAADLLCGRGKGSRAQVASLTATPMLAWIWDQLVGQEQASASSAAPSPLPGFFDWVAVQQEAGKLVYQVKGDDGVEGSDKDLSWLEAAAAPEAAADTEQEDGCGPEAAQAAELPVPASSSSRRSLRR